MDSTDWDKELGARYESTLARYALAPGGARRAYPALGLLLLGA